MMTDHDSLARGEDLATPKQIDFLTEPQDEDVALDSATVAMDTGLDEVSYASSSTSSSSSSSGSHGFQLLDLIEDVESKTPMTATMAEPGWTNLASICNGGMIEDRVFLDFRGCFMVPARPILDEFINQYFLHIHPLLPMVGRESGFGHLLGSNGDRGSSDYQPSGWVSGLLLQSMLFAASPVCSLTTLIRMMDSKTNRMHLVCFRSHDQDSWVQQLSEGETVLLRTSKGKQPRTPLLSTSPSITSTCVIVALRFRYRAGPCYRCTVSIASHLLVPESSQQQQTASEQRVAAHRCRARPGSWCRQGLPTSEHERVFQRQKVQAKYKTQRCLAPPLVVLHHPRSDHVALYPQRHTHHQRQVRLPISHSIQCRRARPRR